MKCKYKKFLKAAYIDYSEDYCGYGSGTFTKPAVTTPIIVITDTTAIIACATSGATIYYTLNGSTPTRNSTEYTGTITLTLSCTIKAIAVKPGLTDSAVATESYVRYLTTWRLAGNSEVHAVYTDPYLTQWKVFGDSVVDNNAILSCGDLGQDGYYHVKISNGVNVFDIALTEPLRKVNDIADSIEFANGTAVLTRRIVSVKFNDLSILLRDSFAGAYSVKDPPNMYVPVITGAIVDLTSCLSGDFVQDREAYLPEDDAEELKDMSMCLWKRERSGRLTMYVYFVDHSINSVADFYSKYGTHEFYYRLNTPTVETIQVPPIAVFSSNAFTSANVIPYSAFTFVKNGEIRSCGEYNSADGKYHIFVQPQGGSIADIALDKPLRKVNDVADSIEFVNGVATVTRNLGAIRISDVGWNIKGDGVFVIKLGKARNNIVMCAGYDTYIYNFSINAPDLTIGSALDNVIYIKDSRYDSSSALTEARGDLEIIYVLANPTTETVQVPQIEKADSYTCIISQSAKAVEWSSFETE